MIYKKNTRVVSWLTRTFLFYGKSGKGARKLLQIFTSIEMGKNGVKQPDIEKVSAYECGFEPFGNPRVFFSVFFCGDTFFSFLFRNFFYFPLMCSFKSNCGFKARFTE